MTNARKPAGQPATTSAQRAADALKELKYDFELGWEMLLVHPEADYDGIVGHPFIMSDGTQLYADEEVVIFRDGSALSFVETRDRLSAVPAVQAFASWRDTPLCRDEAAELALQAPEYYVTLRLKPASDAVSDPAKWDWAAALGTDHVTSVSVAAVARIR